MAPSPCAARILLVLSLAAATLPEAASAQSREHAVYVSVTDKSGNAVLDVAPADFAVREDKTAREVTDVSLADEPLQIALLVDNSSAAESYVRDLREGLTAFVAGITADNPSPARGKHQIAIIGLASRPTILRDYSSDPAQLTKAAQSLFSLPGTGAYLLDAIIETSQGIKKRTTARPVFVAVVADGPESSDRPYDAALRALKAAGVSLNVIKLGRPGNTSRDRAMVMDEGSKTSGGRYEELLAGSALAAKMKQLATDLTHQYRVAYTRPESLIPPDAIAVTVKRAGVTVRSIPAREEPGTERR